jgi:hypothetical protein
VSTSSGRSAQLLQATVLACPDNRELRDHAEHAEQQSSGRVSGDLHATAGTAGDSLAGELVGDVAGVEVNSGLFQSA